MSACFLVLESHSDHDRSQGSTSLLIGEWSFWIFVCAADCKVSILLPAQLITLVAAVVMILRVRALYYQSRLITSVLFALYAMQYISFLVYFILLSARLSSGKSEL